MFDLRSLLCTFVKLFAIKTQAATNWPVLPPLQINLSFLLRNKVRRQFDLRAEQLPVQLSATSNLGKWEGGFKIHSYLRLILGKRICTSTQLALNFCFVNVLPYEGGVNLTNFYLSWQNGER